MLARSRSRVKRKGCSRNTTGNRFHSLPVRRSPKATAHDALPPSERGKQRRLHDERGIARQGKLQGNRRSQGIAAEVAPTVATGQRGQLPLRIGKLDAKAIESFNAEDDRQITHHRHAREGRGIVGSDTEVMQARMPRRQDWFEGCA